MLGAEIESIDLVRTNDDELPNILFTYPSMRRQGEEKLGDISLHTMRAIALKSALPAWDNIMEELTDKQVAVLEDDIVLVSAVMNDRVTADQYESMLNPARKPLPGVYEKYQPETVDTVDMVIRRCEKWLLDYAPYSFVVSFMESGEFEPEDCDWRESFEHQFYKKSMSLKGQQEFREYMVDKLYEWGPHFCTITEIKTDHEPLDLEVNKWLRDHADVQH